MGHYDSVIKANEERINFLHSRIHETFKEREKNEHKRREWENACKKFHESYDSLAFPGGLNGAYDRMVSGDHNAMEAAVCFLEYRPYFFRSGYMFKDILRKIKKAPLTDDQRHRLLRIQEAYEKYRESKSKS